MTLLNELTCPTQSFYADQLDFEECLPKAMDFCLIIVNVEPLFLAVVRFNSHYRLFPVVDNKTIMGIG